MSNGRKDTKCTMGCWAMAALAGLLTLILLMGLSSWSFLGALFVAAMVFVFLGLLLTWILCAPRADSAAQAGHTTATKAATAAGGAVAGAAGAVAGAASGAAETAKDAAASAKDAVAEKVADTAAATKDAVSAVATDTAATAQSAAEATAEAAEAAKAEADAAAEVAAKAAKAEADAAAEEAAKVAKAEADAAAKAAAEAKEAAAETAKKAAAKAKETAAEATPDYDGDGILEGANEGTRPEALDGPRGGKADDLKQIKGIGPKLEKLCNSLGFYHFDQIAGWSADEIAWVNANLAGFKGRVTRDEWVSQAKTLAAGGETEFSKRVEGGKVY